MAIGYPFNIVRNVFSPFEPDIVQIPERYSPRITKTHNYTAAI
jgi:hypothetical protein